MRGPDPEQTEPTVLRLHKPRIYQKINGIKQPIPGGYVLLPRPLGEGRGEGKHHVGFHIAAYDTTKPLIIDPTLSYSTYLGSGSDFPRTNPLQATYGGYIDAFVAKIVEEEEGPVCPATAALEGDLQQGNQEAFAAKASSELQADLRAIQEELRHGALLEQFEIVVR